MDLPASSDNPYAAPAAVDAALDQAPREPAPRFAVVLWLAGLAVCGASFGFDRLSPLKISSEALAVGFLIGIGLSTLAALAVRRRKYVTLALVIAIPIAILLEIMIVGFTEMRLKGIGRFG
jgi:hypothetical protein